jgi:hypothetical protein
MTVGRTVFKVIMLLGLGLCALSTFSILAWGLFSGFWLSGMSDYSTVTEIQSWNSKNEGATVVLLWIAGGMFLGIVLAIAGGIVFLITGLFMKK